MSSSLKTIVLLSIGLLCAPTLTMANCFLAKENNKVIIADGDCEARHAPRCSFNIALSLMMFNEGILIDAANPEFPFQDGYPGYVEKWKQPHNPTLWIKNSCLWYSQVLTKQLGQSKFEAYLKQFNYGNHDVSGDKGKNNGLTRSWMTDSSLGISAEEQVMFLQNLLDRKLQVSSKSYDMTKNIIFISELAGGWKLYGKTGTGDLSNSECGWFVGWLENGKRTIVFANYVEQETQGTPAGRRAKELAKEQLLQIVQGLI